VGGVAAYRLFSAPVDETTLLRFYEAGLLLTGCVLVVALARWASALRDRIVDLGEAATVRDALRRVLGDPSFELGFRQEGDYIDERGRPLEPSWGPERRMTTVTPSGEIVLLHDPAVPLDSSVAEAVARALRLTTENARLQAEAYGQLAELRASRHRLVLARGRQRARLARRLHEGAELRLAGIEAALADVEPAPELAEAVERARLQVGAAREGIASLARGLQPPGLAAEGLAGALAALAESSPVAVSLAVEDRRFEAAVEHAAYLVCSEALANVAKHAQASDVELCLVAGDGWLRLTIADDGRGGADAGGSGLRGLADRVEELGGALRIESPSGGGTRLDVEIPLHPEPHVRKDARSDRAEPVVVAVVGAS
jgi:signal transduction histidine kinase